MTAKFQTEHWIITMDRLYQNPEYCLEYYFPKTLLLPPWISGTLHCMVSGYFDLMNLILVEMEHEYYFLLLTTWHYFVVGSWADFLYKRVWWPLDNIQVGPTKETITAESSEENKYILGMWRCQIYKIDVSLFDCT